MVSRFYKIVLSGAIIASVVGSFAGNLYQTRQNMNLDAKINRLTKDYEELSKAYDQNESVFVFREELLKFRIEELERELLDNESKILDLEKKKKSQ